MVLPEGTPDTDRPRSRGRVVTFGVAALALALGAVALGALTAPEPEAVAPSTTTTTLDPVDEPTIDPDDFTVADIAQGEPLDWEHFMSIDEGFPMGLFSNDGWVYLFATDTPNFAGFDEGGLRAWRTDDGSNWESLGQVIDTSHIVLHVNVTGQGFIAVDEGQPGKGITVWESADGVEWTSDVIEVDGLTENMVIVPQASGGNDDTVVVAGRKQVDLSSLIDGTLPNTYGYNVSPASLGWRTSLIEQELRFVIHGPLGFPLFEIDADDLGLTEDERTVVVEEYRARAGTTDIWVSSGDGQWQSSEIQGLWVESISVGPEGQMLATGTGNSGGTLWSSFDGLSWESFSLAGAYHLETWNDMVVAPSSGLASFAVSEVGDVWERIGPWRTFPWFLSWGIGVVAAGDGGLAATVAGTPSVFGPIEDAEPVSVTEGDATLTINYVTRAYTLEIPGFTQTWSMDGLTRPEEIEVDPISDEIAFHHPDTGEFLASFGIDELFQAEERFYETQFPQVEEHRALIFSPDGEEWTIQDLDDHMADVRIQLLEVTDTHVITAVVGARGRFSPSESPGFEIWSAPIP